MKKQINLKWFDEIAVYLLFLGYLIDLSGKMGIRFILVYPSLIFLILRSLKNNINYNYLFFLTFSFFVYPLLLSIYSFTFFDKNNLIISQFMSTFQMVFIFLAIKDFDPLKLLNQFLDSILIIQIFSILIFVGCLLNISFFLNLIDILGRPFNGGYFGFLRVGDFALPQLYFKSTLIFVFPTVYFFSIKKYTRAFLSLTILILALSKSGSMLAILGILYFIFKRRKLFDLIFIFLVFLIIIYFGESYLENYLTLSDSYTAEVRKSQYRWFINFIVNEPVNFLFGSGFGNSIFINNSEVVALELDHIDTIRKYGFVWFMFVFSLLFFKIFHNRRFSNKKEISLSYLLTFIAVGTNPLLLTSVFFILSFIVYRLMSDFEIHE